MPEAKENLKNPDVAYERKDVYVRGIAIFVLMLVLGAIPLHFGMEWFFNYLKSSTTVPKNQIVRASAPLPPEPRLQLAPGHAETPQSEMEALRHKQDSLLSGYGWIDSANGIVHIPIESAKVILLKEGWGK